MPEQIVEPVARVERHQHAGMADDTEQPERADRHEPERHDRAEQTADARGALGLQAEQRDENADRERQHVGRECRQRCLDPLERAQHRYRGGDGAVAIEQGGAENAKGDHAGAFAMLDAEQRHQRQDAALAVVVGAHHDRDVFDRRGDDERPHDQRQHAEHRGRRCLAACPCDRRLEGVERARADVAVDHAKSRQRHGSERPAGRRLLCRSRDDRHRALLWSSKGNSIGARICAGAASHMPGFL